MPKVLSSNIPAPDFELRVTAYQTLSLSKLKGKPIILAFLSRGLELSLG